MKDWIVFSPGGQKSIWIIEYIQSKEEDWLKNSFPVTKVQHGMKRSWLGKKPGNESNTVELYIRIFQSYCA